MKDEESESKTVSVRNGWNFYVCFINWDRQSKQQTIIKYKKVPHRNTKAANFMFLLSKNVANARKHSAHTHFFSNTFNSC